MSTFQIYQAENGEWRWRLRANNGEIVAQGEGHTTKQDAVRAVVTARAVAKEANLQVED